MTDRVIHGRASGYGANWYEGKKRRCPVCKKEFRALITWAYQDGYKNSRNYYCSWSHLRQAQIERAKKRKQGKAPGTEDQIWEPGLEEMSEEKRPRKHGGGRPKVDFTPELEAEIRRRYLAGQRAAVVSREMGINPHGIYNRYRQWKAEEAENG